MRAYWYPSGLEEFGIANSEQACRKVDVGQCERQGFADSKPRGIEEKQQGAEGGRLNLASSTVAEEIGYLNQSAELIMRVNVGLKGTGRLGIIMGNGEDEIWPLLIANR